MGYRFYVKIKGQKQGDIKGGVTQHLYEDQIGGLFLSQEVVSPRDAASGLPTGKRLHKPLLLRKGWDKATPLLFQALVDNENLTSVEIRFVGPTSTGVEQVTHKIKLTNANIASIQRYTASVDLANEYETYELEDVSFTYQRIELTSEPGNVTASDDFTSPH